METLTFSQARQSQENRMTEILNNNQVFWAFNKEQFEEGAAKNPIQADDKYVSIGAGGYMPKSRVAQFNKDVEENQANFRKTIQENNLQNDEIAYHLNNHECYYTGDIDIVVDMFKGVYTREEIVKAFYENATADWR